MSDDMDLFDNDLFKKLPEVGQCTLRDYIVSGTPPGGFMTAVLSNNLMRTFDRADLTNRKAVYDYVAYLWNYAPPACYGSPENVEQWIKQRGLNGS